MLQQQTLTLFCDYKTPAADTESLDTLDPPKNGNKKRKHKNKKKHKWNQSMLYSIVFTWHVWTHNVLFPLIKGDVYIGGGMWMKYMQEDPFGELMVYYVDERIAFVISMCICLQRRVKFWMCKMNHLVSEWIATV